MQDSPRTYLIDAMTVFNRTTTIILALLSTIYITEIVALPLQFPFSRQIADLWPTPVPPPVVKYLKTAAHLIDISYCISDINQIQPPFQCDLNCSESFPDMKVIYQWYFDDAVVGYLAKGNKVFDETGTRPVLILSLRGTRSAPDTYTDLNIEMTPYRNPGKKLEICGENCRVHKGFYESYLETFKHIEDVLIRELEAVENSKVELHIMGHSLGGAVALLITLQLKDLGFNSKLTTMGQPLVGNADFVRWCDRVLGSSNSIESRPFWRIVHKKDVVTTIPNKDLNIEFKVIPPFLHPLPLPSIQDYVQFDNQIYINCTAHDIPTNEEIVDCYSGNSQYCIKQDFSAYDRSGQHIAYDAHLWYFRRMGFCGISVFQ